MAYTFNDDKSKANIVVFEATLRVLGNHDHYLVISASQLASYGIDDINKYELIGLSQTINQQTGRLYHPAYHIRDGADVNHIEIEPFCRATHTGDLDLYVYNPIPSDDYRNFTFRFVFMKVA